VTDPYGRSRPEIVDETRGPGTPLMGGNLQEIWKALGHDDGRIPVLDEVLQEIDRLRAKPLIPTFPHNEKTVVQPAPDGLRQMTYPDGQVITGYTADDVLKLRIEYLREDHP
jgi:hypothetical protein